MTEEKPSRQRQARNKPETKEETKPKRQDTLTPQQRRARNTEVLAKQFQGANAGIALRLQDPYYEVSSVEADQWAEAMIDTGEWLGVSEIPPPLTLLAITLNIYIPRFFHYWVTGRDVEYAEEGEDVTEPPAYVGA